MYATCLWCTRALGRNETIEAFPIGRRLAYDAAKGRLWVVCPSCERWNLTPLDARWEAIEACERLYGGTRLRASTDQVGLARIVPPKGDGLELVRIGAPLRPELAAWRYGDQFGRRRRRALVLGGVGGAAALAAGVGAAYVGAAVLGGGLVVAGFLGRAAFGVVQGRIAGSSSDVVARVTLGATGGRVHAITRGQVAHTTLGRDGEGGAALRLHLEGRWRVVTGSEALGLAARLLPAANARGAPAADVQSAVRRLEAASSLDVLLRSATRGAPTWTPGVRRRIGQAHTDADDSLTLPNLAPSTRLALEMALHEDEERRALEGELQELARRWQEADAIAAIADALAVPPAVEAKLAALRSEAARHAG